MNQNKMCLSATGNYNRLFHPYTYRPTCFQFILLSKTHPQHTQSSCGSKFCPNNFHTHNWTSTSPKKDLDKAKVILNPLYSLTTVWLVDFIETYRDRIWEKSKNKSCLYRCNIRACVTVWSDFVSLTSYE